MNNYKYIFLVLSICSNLAFSQSKVSATRIGDRIDITINDKFFTSYIFAENDKYPFFYPVNGPLMPQ